MSPQPSSSEPADPGASAACAAVRERLNEYLDGELPSDLDTATREHLAVCERCRREAEHQRAFLGRLQRMESSAAPDSLRARIRSLLRGENR